MSTVGGNCPIKTDRDQIVVAATFAVIVGIVAQLLGLSAHAAAGLERKPQLAAPPPAIFGPSTAPPEPLQLRDTALEPIEWSALKGWSGDDHVAAFATFLASCRSLLRSSLRQDEKRPMYAALTQVCRRALVAGRLAEDQARLFFERNFRPMHITRLGDSAGFLTGYFEPIVDGSRVPYYDRGEILDGALDGKRLEICWIKNKSDALTIQIQGSARVRLEDGAMLRINYDGHNGYPFVPLSRILIERNVIAREEMSLERIREWVRANPQSAEEFLRQNRSFMFFRIVGLTDDRQAAGYQEKPREAIGAQGITLTPTRSIAVDNALHVYGTPFFIEADLPLTDEKRGDHFDHLMIAQDTGSAIVGPARADIFWGAGERAGQLASHVHHAGTFAMLVPRELDPVWVRMPLPPQKPPPPAEAKAKTQSPKIFCCAALF